MAVKLIQINSNNSYERYEGKSASVGSGDAGEYVVLDANGTLDDTLFPDIRKIKEVATAPSGNPPSGYIYLYVLASDKHLYQKDSEGVITDLAAGGIASISWGDIGGDLADQTDLQTVLSTLGNGISDFGSDITDLQNTIVKVKEVTIDLGSKPTRSKAIVVTDADINTSSLITVVGSGNPASGRGMDDFLWDGINFVAKPEAGQMTVYATSNTRVKGNRKIIYTIKN
jgi:hypothetical protein